MKNIIKQIFLITICVVFLSSCAGISEMFSVLFLPNYIVSNKRTEIDVVKANMYTVMVMVETFAVDRGGTYPQNLSILYDTVKKLDNSYYKNPIYNPYKKIKGFINNKDIAIDFNNYKKSKSFAGTVVYKPIKEKNKITKYEIYGCDKNGEFIKEKGKIFKLLNSE